MTAASGRVLRGPEIAVRAADAGPDENRRYAMRALGYITAVTIAAASAALALLVVLSVPDVRRYMKIRKM